MKSLMLLWQSLADELASICRTQARNDGKTIIRRSKKEGMSFLTITLPTFCRDFEQALDLGVVSPIHFRGFGRRGGTPQFLGGFLDQIFDRSTGRLLEEPNIDSIFAVRQLTLLYSKILIPCSDARVLGAIEGYLECERQLKEEAQAYSLAIGYRRIFRNTKPSFYLDYANRIHDLKSMGRLLFRDVFTRLDSDVYTGKLVPKHGPGATADRLRGNAKLDQHEWTTRLEEVFPFGEYAIPSWRSYYLLDHVEWREPGSERPVRVITVPKTLKTPRIIAIEPTCMQYMQQALMEKFVEYLEDDEVLSGMIGFTDQTPNQDLACQGSFTGTMATLDLSEASDRVLNLHVRALMSEHSNLDAAVQATRSLTADVPGHGVITLAKFASMGSALCFPVEAMTFLACIFLGIQDMLKRPLTRKDVKVFSSRVRVYGDDLIVPVQAVPYVQERLEAFGHKVNNSKSFWTGKFRESCGKEYYDGFDVSISRFRREFPTARTDVEEIVSLVAFRNQLYKAGLWTTVRWLDEQVEKLLPHYPAIYPTSPVLGRHSVLGFDNHGYSDELHVPLVRGYVVATKPPLSPVTGEGALLKGFLKRSEEPFADRDHLERTGRPDAVRLKLRLVPHTSDFNCW